MVKQKVIIFLSYSILLFLFLSMLQNFFGFREVIELNGVDKEYEEPKWYWDTWFNGSYQKSIEDFNKSNFGLREDLIRMNNDRVYAWYNESTNKELIIGKDNYIFGKEYIDEYLGRDYIGKIALKEKVDYLKVISKECKLRGKTFLLVLAPSKAYYDSEYLPDGYIKKDSTNYAVFLSEAKAQGIEILDVNDWFLNLKSTTSYPLFPEKGTHWSNYGVSIFMDSLLRDLEQRMGQDLPELIIDSLWVSDSLRSPDNDLELLLNLSSPTPVVLPHAYVRGHFQLKYKYRPKVITIGDSFWGTFQFEDYLPKNCFANSSCYWYYNSTVFPGGRQRTEKDLYELERSDVVLMVVTTINLPNFAWGGLGGLKNYFVQTEEAIIQGIIEEMKADQRWYSELKNKAKEYTTSLDSILYRDAVYIMNQRKSK